MAFQMTSRDFMGYMEKAAEKIKGEKDYVSALDAATGDGDHWANINMGFESILAEKAELEQKPMCDVLKRIGMLMMSKIGGSSGILYGGAYIAASKALAGKETLCPEDLCTMLSTMVQDMMTRGKAQPGFKTMIDALYPAAQAYRNALDAGADDRQALQLVRQAATDGAESTRNMEAVKGRASYQTNKGVGHLDPGAVTMSYQLECLCDYALSNLL